MLLPLFSLCGVLQRATYGSLDKYVSEEDQTARTAPTPGANESGALVALGPMVRLECPLFTIRLSRKI